GTGFIGFVEPAPDGAPGKVTYGDLDFYESLGFLVGERHEVLGMLDLGPRITYSTGRTYEPDGRITRTFAPLVFHDGAAIVRVPPQRPTLTLALLHPPPSGGGPGA